MPEPRTLNPDPPMPKPKLSHLDSQGRASMVNVSAKPPLHRQAIAEGYITLQPATLRAITHNALPKGEVLSVARIAGILAAKRTADLIPLCHPLPLEHVELSFDLPKLSPQSTHPLRLRIQATARIHAKTGVEMEALTAVSLAALTIYDMCKAIDKSMTISDIRLLQKTKSP